MSDSEPIVWKGQLVGHIEDIESGETWDMRTIRYHGRWIPLQTQTTLDFLKHCEEHFHVEVSIEGDTVPFERMLFSIGLGETAWLLHIIDYEELHASLMKQNAPDGEQDDST